MRPVGPFSGWCVELLGTWGAPEDVQCWSRLEALRTMVMLAPIWFPSREGVSNGGRMPVPNATPGVMLIVTASIYSLEELW